MTDPDPLRPRAPIHWVPRIVVLSFIVVTAAWFGLGGYERWTAPNPRWRLPNGDTIEVLSYENEYGMSVSVSAKAQGLHSLSLTFRASPNDSRRDSGDVLAAAQLLCHWADSLGLSVVHIQPAHAVLFGVVTYYRDFWFHVRAGGSCDAVASHP